MSKSRSSHITTRAPAAHAAPEPRVPAPQPALEPRAGFRAAWVRFWFTPVDPVGLHAVRVLTGLLLLFWLLSFLGHQEALFGLNGWFDRRAYGELPLLPPGTRGPVIDWSLLYVFGNDPSTLTAVYWGSVAILALFTAGVATRVTAVLTWLIVGSFTMNPLTLYDFGGEALLQILSFYLMVGYLFLGLRRACLTPGELTPVELALGPNRALLLGGGGTRPPSLAANLALRLLQVHFAVVVVTSMLHKLQFGEWWSGGAFWYPLYPVFETTLEGARAHAAYAGFYLTLLSLAAYLMLAWELTFPLFAWRTGRWRAVLLGGAVLGWVGSAFVYAMPLFGPAYLTGALCFLTAAEWKWAISRLTRIPGLEGLSRWLPAAPEPGEWGGRREPLTAGWRAR